MARLLTDASPLSNIYPPIEQVRRRGRMSPVERAGWVSADAQIVREVLRDGRFRTIKPRDRSPFRVVEWILAKTDPDVLSPLGMNVYHRPRRESLVALCTVLDPNCCL